MPNEELTKGLKEAKVKPRLFALAWKGQDPALIVQKKKIPPPMVLDLKASIKGTGVASGLVEFKSGTLLFKSKSAIALRPAALKAFIKENTGISAAVEFKQVDSLDEEGE